MLADFIVRLALTPCSRVPAYSKVAIVPVTSAHSGFPMWNVASIRKYKASYAFQNTTALFAASGDDPSQRASWGTIEVTWMAMRMPSLYVLTRFRPSYGAWSAPPCNPPSPSPL